MSVRVEVDGVVVEFLGYQVTYAEDYLYKGREEHMIYLADKFIYLKHEDAEKRIEDIKKLEPSARLFSIEEKWRGT